MSIINLRTKAAFGGVMGKDGRKAYVGGSYSGSTSSSGKGSQGSGKGYQGGSGAAGSAESGKSVGSEGGPSYDSGTVSGDTYRDSKKAFDVSVYQPKEIPAYVPGGTYVKALRKLVGTPFTKTGKISTANKRMNYINSLPPRERKAMIDRLGLAMDEDYEEGEINYGTELYGDPLAMGKNIYGIDSLDIINYDGEYMKKYGPKPQQGTGGQTILPYPYNVQQPDEKEVPEDTGPEYRFGTGQDVIFDDYGTPGYRNTRAEGGIMGTRARKAMGGIMERVDKRQQFFLGGIGKAIGKAVGKVGKAAGKVLSSDIGKMAIAGAAFYYGGGGMKAFNSGSGFMSGLGKMGANFMSTKNPLLFNAAGNLSLGKLGLVSAALPFLMPPAKPNEDIGMTERGGRLLDSKGNEALPSDLRAEVQEAYAAGS